MTHETSQISPRGRFGKSSVNMSSIQGKTTIATRSSVSKSSIKCRETIQKMNDQFQQSNIKSKSKQNYHLESKPAEKRVTRSSARKTTSPAQMDTANKQQSSHNSKHQKNHSNSGSSVNKRAPTVSPTFTNGKKCVKIIEVSPASTANANLTKAEQLLSSIRSLKDMGFQVPIKKNQQVGKKKNMFLDQSKDKPGLEGIDAIHQIDLKQLMPHNTKQRPGKKSRKQSKADKQMVGQIPPYTLELSNDTKNNSLLKIDPYERFIGKNGNLNMISGFNQQTKKAVDQKKNARSKKNMTPQQIPSMTTDDMQQNYEKSGKTEGQQQQSLKSGSIKRPTLSSSFYLYQKQLQQACVQPFQSNDQQTDQPSEIELSETELAKRKLVKLFCSKKQQPQLLAQFNSSKAHQSQNANGSELVYDKEIRQNDDGLQQLEVMGGGLDSIIEDCLQENLCPAESKKIKAGKQTVNLRSRLLNENLTPSGNDHHFDESNMTPSQVFTREGCHISPPNQTFQSSSNQNYTKGYKCPSSISSFVGKFLAHQQSSGNAKAQVHQNIEEMNEIHQNLNQEQIQKITAFAQQARALKQLKQIKGIQLGQEDDLLDDEEVPEQHQQEFAQLTEKQISLLKTIPKHQLQEHGLGDLDLNELGYDVTEEFLSESSFSETDFNLLKQDNFFELMQEIQRDVDDNQDQSVESEQITQQIKQQSPEQQILSEIQEKDMEMEENSEDGAESTKSAFSPESIAVFKLPVYDPKVNYVSEFYNLLTENQNLLRELEDKAEDRNKLLSHSFRIKDYYDRNISSKNIKRYPHNKRKIHDRRTMAQLQRDQQCPYESCLKQFASEGSLNLHIKQKHNGGNKTEREKLAKQLIMMKLQGFTIPDTLVVNLPPGIIKKAAEQIKLLNNIDISENDIELLEEKLANQNRITDERMKKMLLEKKHEDFVCLSSPKSKNKLLSSSVLMNDSEVFKEPYVVKHQKIEQFEDKIDANGFGALNDQTAFMNNVDAQIGQTTLCNLKLDSQCSFTCNQPGPPQKKRQQKAMRKKNSENEENMDPIDASVLGCNKQMSHTSFGKNNAQVLQRHTSLR